VAAWLHDMGKCADEHIITQASDKPKDYSYKYKTAQSFRLPDSLNGVSLLKETVSIRDLIEKGIPGVIKDTQQPWLLRVLGRCHSAAHVEKELGKKDAATKQPKADTRLSTAYGIEGNAVTGLTAQLDALTFSRLMNRSDFLPEVQNVFQQALSDTRRPVNEVTLADWSGAVAALYKAALAGTLLGIKPECDDPDNLRWRVLRVNFDALALYAKAVKIADLLAYQRAVDDACKEIKRLVEEEYPLGNEIYRDTSGIYFTFPDLDLPAELEQEIRRRVEAVEPELAPRIAVTVGAVATAQDDQPDLHARLQGVTVGADATAQEQLKGILGQARREAQKDLAQPFDARNLSPCWQREWEAVGAGQWEVCPVCRLHPKPEGAEACQHCLTRRQSRIKAWKDNPVNTIWIGEIADANDRVALLVGKFGLDDWLSGDLVQTMLVSASKNDPAKCVSKNASPARLRRVWETCQRFWEQTVQQEILTAQSEPNVRKWITLSKNSWEEQLYNGKVNGKPLDLFWMPEQKAFLTVSSLQAAGDLVKGANVTLENPDTKKQIGEFQIQSIQDAPEPYRHYPPSLALHASPDQFLAFVPADRALQVIEQIRTQYERQFGKVRNRLPLALGAVFCERKMPLQAVLDAARQMFTRPIVEERWKISKADGKGRLEFDNGVCWNVPTLMGDGETEDVWYPYVKLAGEPAAHHDLRFEQGGAHWTHVKTLQRDDSVCLTPSTFDFLWLDTAARRFEAHYDERGRRPARPSRPYYLEEFARLEASWERFSHLSRSQMKQTLQAIEEARQRWFGRDKDNQSASDPIFRGFVKDVLANAQWDWRSIPEPERDALIKAGARGALNDLAELHLEILKEKNEGANS